MVHVPFNILDDNEVRKPSRVRLVLALLVAILLILSIVFIALYAVEKSKSGSEETATSKHESNGTRTTTGPTGNPKNFTTPMSHITTSNTSHITSPTSPITTPTSRSTTQTSHSTTPTSQSSTSTSQITTSTSHSTTSTSHSTTPTSHSTTPASVKTCTSASCVVSAADILNKLDESTNPCDDFYQYSCGGFIKKTHLPDGKGHVDVITTGTDFVQYSLQEIFQNEKLMSNYTKGSAVHKAFIFYKSCMNESSIKEAGVKPMLDVIEQHGSWNITNKHWRGDSWKLEKILARVVVDLETPAFLALDVTPSYFNGSENVIAVRVGNSGYDERQLSKKQSRTRLSEKHFESKEFDVYEDYKKFMSTVFSLLGANATTVDEEVKRIVELEQDFMGVDVTWFDPTDTKKYRRDIKFMTVDELNNLTSYKFNWSLYFEEVLNGTNVSVASDTKLMIILPNSIKNVVNWLMDQPKGLLANEIMWNVVRGFIDTLPVAFGEAHEKYIESIINTKKADPRWKTCNRLADNYFEYVTTLLYVNAHLPEGATETAAEMFKEIKGQFIDGLEEQHWMDNATRAQARLKLKKMREWIGFPPFIKYPAELNKFYKDVQVNESLLLQNTLNGIKDKFLKKVDEVDKPSNNSRFLVPPLTVNAFYNPLANGMTILAGILQPPFYKSDRLQALNYGSLGMVVGHEITHGFDKQGSEYDENGVLRNWWTKKSYENFVNRSKCLVEEYNKVKIFGYQVDGNKTLSENIADNGGLKYAFRAYNKWRAEHGDEDKLPALPFNNEQLFFVGFAQLWCAKYTKDGAKSQMDIDTHSLDPVRVRVPLSNFPEFSKAFGCTPPKHTCTVW